MNPPTAPALLQLQDLGFAHADQPALVSGWSVSIVPGVTLLHGDTGSGKSTLLRVLAGTLPATGRLTLAGVRLDEDPASYRRQVFFCEPANDVFDRVTPRALRASLDTGDTPFSEARWQALVTGFALAAHLDKPLYALSTGTKRKVWLAAALASACTLTLLDEPTAGLDAASVACLREALARLSAQTGRAIVIASAAGLEGVPLAAVIELPLG